MALTPTDEQIAILSLVTSTTDNILINALAGTGKTATLELIHEIAPRVPILYLAFNNRIVKEMATRLADHPSPMMVKTFNALGHSIWAKANARVLLLNKSKTADILRTIIDESPKSARSILWSVFWDVVEAVAMAKAIGYIPEGKYTQVTPLADREALTKRLSEPPDDLTWDLIDETLTRSIKAAYSGTIDFNDQIYMPALFGGAFPRFPIVKVDEAQDLSPTNHAMLHKLCHGRIIAVGDPQQSIYQFRGAKQGGMADLKQRFSMTEADLSISFRCPRAVVEAARWRVPTFRWIKDGGHVERLNEIRFGNISEQGAIICRNNAPLFRVGMQLLRRGRSIAIAGSDISPKVIGIMRKLGDESISRSGTTYAIEDWRARRLAKGSTTADDIADCMLVFANSANSLGGAIAYAQHLFEQRGSIQLLTGHKAKGLEFDTVYMLDPWLIGDGEQEDNLRYVIQTRAAEALYEIDSDRIIW